MTNTRLVKVALPSDLVASMDMFVTGSPAYNGRQDFMSDAVANLLADLEAETPDVPPVLPVAHEAKSSSGRAVSPVPEYTSAAKFVEPMETGVAQALAMILFPSDTDTPTTRPSARPEKPTWGIHNRDFPTLWAAGLLSRAATPDQPILYHTWLRETVEIAWQMTDALRSQGDVDLSGFPSNREKADKSEARFVRFFVGEESGRGPLFDLALASDVGEGRVMITEPGLELLEIVKGWTPRSSYQVDVSKTDAFLRHLAAWVPADFELMKHVISEIAEGYSNRERLVSRISTKYPDWTEKVASTNVAGYIGRAREWGLIRRRQENRQYVLSEIALDALERAVDATAGGQGSK